MIYQPVLLYNHTNMKKLLSALAVFSIIVLGSVYSAETQVVTATSFTPVQCAQTTLAGAGVTSSATTITLTSFTSAGGTPLTMSNFGSNGYIVLEPNSTSKIENITFTGITQNSNGSAILTGVTRGISFTAPFVATTALQKQHAGGSYAICSNPAVFYQNEFVEVNGNNTIWPTASSSPASKGYADYVGSGGANIIPATTIAQGVVQLATGGQQASSTPVGSTGFNLVPWTSNATDTPTATCNATYAAKGANCAVVANTLGHIDPGFVSSSTSFSVSASSTLMASTSIGNFMALNIGKNMFISTSTGTSTWAVPAGISRALVELCGAGGGGTVNAGGASNEVGGGAGATAIGIINFPATSTIQFFIGTGGIGVSGSGGTTGGWATFGTNGFYMSAQGGNGGNGAAGVSPATANGPIALAGFVPSIQSMSGTNFGAGNFFFAKGAPSQLGGYSSCYGGDNNSSGSTSGTSGGNAFLEVIY